MKKFILIALLSYPFSPALAEPPPAIAEAPIRRSRIVYVERANPCDPALKQLFAELMVHANEDTTRAPGNGDYLNFLVSVVPDEHGGYQAVLLKSAQPSLNAHVDLMQVAHLLSRDTGGDARVVHVGGGETVGNYSVFIDTAGTFAARSLPNNLDEAVNLIEESWVGQQLLAGRTPKRVHYQDREGNGHLNPRILSKGEPGDVYSVFHDARSGIVAILGPFEVRRAYLATGSTEATVDDEIPQDLWTPIGRAENVNPILALIDLLKVPVRNPLAHGSQPTGQNAITDGKVFIPSYVLPEGFGPIEEVLPPKLQKLRDLLVKARDGKIDPPNKTALTPSELTILDQYTRALLAGLSDPPIEVHHLGRVEKGTDGLWHIVGP